jgi:exosortase/archaeosortase family protein
VSTSLLELPPLTEAPEAALGQPSQAAAGRRPRRSALLRVAAVGLATGGALPFSLVALAEDYRYGATLGELALVPLCGMALALVAAYRHPWVAQLRPGRADHVVAVAALALAATVLTLGPVVTGNYYYALRPDLLAVPLVAVTAVCLLLGVRALVAMVVPLLVSLLAWPLPLRAVLEPTSEVVASATSGAVRAVLAVLPLATVVPSPGDLRLTVPGPAGAFDVLVASACSGISGIVGMLLVGLAAQYVLHGPLRARLLWLASAVALAWLLNLMRIVLLLAVGRLFGQHLAMDAIHPVAGLVLLNAGMAVLVLCAGRYGLRVGLQREVPSDTPLTAPAPAADRMRPRVLRRRAVGLTVAVGVLAALDSTVPGTAMAYQGGLPAVVSFAQAPSAGPGLAITDRAEKPWARRYFGGDSSWARYRARPETPGQAPTLWVDSITTTAWSALRAHPVLDCYRFHDFTLVSVARPTLAAGLLADEVVYRRPDGATWHVLSWEWPVRTAGGALGHERVVLLASSQRTDIAPAATGESGGDGLRSLLARRLGAGGTGGDPNPALAASLRSTATSIIGAHLVAAAPGTSS